jgi:hypothetical protein
VLIQKNYASSVEEATSIHKRYIELTRQAAKETGAELLDLAAIFADPQYDRFFSADGIHFGHYEIEHEPESASLPQPGLAAVASEIDKKIRQIVTTPEWRVLQEEHDKSALR